MFNFEKLGIKYNPEFDRLYFQGAALYKKHGDYIFDKQRICLLQNKYKMLGEHLDLITKTADVIKTDKAMAEFCYFAIAAAQSHTPLYSADIPDFKDPETDFCVLFSLLFFCEDMVREYEKRGLSEKIIADTLGEFARCIEAYRLIHKRPGIRGYFNWLCKFIRGDIIKVDRFNIEMTKFQDKDLIRTREGELMLIPSDESPVGSVRILCASEEVLSIHIPASEPLGQKYVYDSLKYAKKVIKESYPEYNAKAFVCFSWMMNPELRTILGKETDLTRFCDVFEKFPLGSSGGGIYSFVFHLPEAVENSLLPEDSSLQRGIKKYLSDGKIFYDYGGIYIPESMS